MGDMIIINYGKLEEAGRNITRLKESLYRIDRSIEAERCLGLLYADPCMDPHNDIWVSDGLGGGHYIPDEAKLSRERWNGHTMESLEDELYKARGRVREEQAYADRRFGEKVLAFENMDADLVLEKAEVAEIDTIEIPGFPGFEFDPENFDYAEVKG
jgi:hypothetical protein